MKGRCILQDEMQTLYPFLKEAKILILASPVHIPLPGEIQTFLNRLCPLLNPRLRWVNGRTRIQFHDDVNIQKIAGVITRGVVGNRKLGYCLAYFS